jgi:lipopolysaccharide heptosyltransferase II
MIKNIDKNKIKKILILRPRAIGDVILTTPFIRNVKREFPDAQIDYLVEPFVKPVLEGNPYITNIILLQRQKIKNEPENVKAIKNKLQNSKSSVKIIDNIKFYLKFFKNRYDLVFDLWGNLRTALISFLTGAKYRVGFTFRFRKYFYNIKVKPDICPKYNVHYHLDLLRAIGIEPDSEKTEFYISNSDEIFIKEFLKNSGITDRDILIGLNPNGSWVTKRWFEKKFAKLAELILKEIADAKIIILWGPGELGIAQNIINAISYKKEKVILAPETNLKEMGALIKNLDLIVTNDGAASHIAVALDTKSLTIYGPTNPKSWSPSGNKRHLALAPDVLCAPCDKTVCPFGTIECMNRIKEEDVFLKLKELLNL